MSAIREDQIKNASAFMNDFWKNFVKAYYNPEDSDEWWSEVFAVLSEIGNKYCGTDRRLMKILLGFESGLEEVMKIERGR